MLFKCLFSLLLAAILLGVVEPSVKLLKRAFLRTILVPGLKNLKKNKTKKKTFFSYSTQLSTKLILLINVKTPTIAGVLTFISMINTPSERLKARHFFFCLYFSFYEQLKFRAHLS